MIQVENPFTEEKIRSLRVGDMVELSGTIFTGRDAVHKWLHDGGVPPFDLHNGVIYHCGPVAIREKGCWKIIAAGPTTSIREESYQAEIIKRLGLRAIIGKGGMGEKTAKACQDSGCAYLHAIGGAAQVLANAIDEVEDVFGIDQFGSPEAMWKLRVRRFPVVVTMDSHGGSLHREIEMKSAQKLSELLI